MGYGVCIVVGNRGVWDDDFMCWFGAVGLKPGIEMTCRKCVKIIIMICFVVVVVICHQSEAIKQ